ncbi:MAG: hypothetical protein ACYS7Y_29570 [Planctomycetota bacterium]|jgi:hypothetical protein
MIYTVTGSNHDSGAADRVAIVRTDFDDAECSAELMIECGYRRVEVSHKEGCVTEIDTYYSKEVLNAQQ